MRITLADKFIAWLALLSGLTISTVAIWYSVAGLVSIFAAAVVPIIVMGVVLEVSKLIATIWLKLNWSRAPVFIRTYLLAAIAILMVITSMGIFGFLSKAHSDAGLVSGDVQSRIAIYDEKIKTAKENIEANRKQLKQMDEAVDQVMARSTDEKGADKANNIRRAQQRDRTALAKDIEANQKLIAKLNDEAAPIRAEVRKVEAEVGPIKYIANFIYGDNPDTNILEKAVTWVIIIIVVVFDPLAVILLLASQYSFQWFRKEENSALDPIAVINGQLPPEELNEQLIAEANFKLAEIEKEIPETILPEEPKESEIDYSKHAYLNTGKSFWTKPDGYVTVPPLVYKPENQFTDGGEHPSDTFDYDQTDESVIEEPKFKILPELQKELDVTDLAFPETPFTGQQYKFVTKTGEEKNYIFNGTDWIFSPVNNSNFEKESEDSKKKITYMIKEQGQQLIKTRE